MVRSNPGDRLETQKLIENLERNFIFNDVDLKKLRIKKNKNPTGENKK